MMTKNMRPERSDWRSAAPMTYVIQGTFEKMASDEFQKQAAIEPPNVIHGQRFTPICSVWGPVTSWRGERPPRATPEQVRQKTADLKALNDAFNAMGTAVLPYINSQAIGGDHEKRTGFWEFYDRWDEYAEFGLGPKPKDDPVEWMKEDRERGNFTPYFRYTPCPNNPYWRQFLLALTEGAARAGTRAAFVDENTIYHYGRCCREKFKRWLTETYPPELLEKWFGTSDPERLEMAGEGQGRAWVETLRFWAQSNADLLWEIVQAGRKIHPGFWATPNAGPMAHCHGIEKRSGVGIHPGEWARVCELIMFEEMLPPGLFAPGYVYDHQMQYKLAYAEGFRAGILAYQANTPALISLGMAEASAYGGGCFQQCGFEPWEPRESYARFWRRNRDLYHGNRSYAQIAVCFDYEQLFRDNVRHVRAAYRLRQHLADHGYLFDLLTPKMWTPEELGRFQVVIAPHLEYLSGKSVAALRRYASGGGRLIVTPDTGLMDDSGARREITARELFRRRSVVVEMDALLPPRPFEIFLQQEDMVNNLWNLRSAYEDAVRNPSDAMPGRRFRLDEILLERVPAGPCGFDPMPYTVRVAAWLREESGGARLVLHFVNYDIPFPDIYPEAAPRPAGPFAYQLVVPPGYRWDGSKAECLSPESGGCSAGVEQEGDLLKVSVRGLGTYGVVPIALIRA
ncbi:MAG TPA: beta-galactosidase trimerization domain-containing protein [Candidatus Brocadiia bacterium]|nr:beta-galactosidase trimerization domain-containing protein [Candidatus Brocadiia bacterium]